MRPEQHSPARTRATLLALGGALVVVAILRRVGIPDTIIYGLAGGLFACLIIIALDRLHSVERRLNEHDDPPSAPPPRTDDR